MKPALTLLALLVAALGSVASLHAAERRSNFLFIYTDDHRWDGFPWRIPPALLGIGELNDRLAISMAYGPDQSQKRGPLFIEPCKWHSFAGEIRWSRNADGRDKLFLDDMTEPAGVLDRPNMHNDFQHFLKLGIYRHPEIATDNWIYLDDLTITTQDM